MASDNHAPRCRLSSWKSSMTTTPASSVVRRALALVWLALGGLAGAQAPAPPARGCRRQDVARRGGQPRQRRPGGGACGQKEQAESKLREAAAVPNLSMFEQAVIERGRAGVSLSARDWPQAIRSLEVVVTSNQFSGADQLQMVELLSKLTYQEKDYLRAVSWLRRYLQEGGSDARCAICCRRRCTWPMNSRRPPTSSKRASRPTRRRGRTPPEATLRLLISSYVQAQGRRRLRAHARAHGDELIRSRSTGPSCCPG